jgi:hypothetical protein
VDFDKNGDISSAVFEVWQYTGPVSVETLRAVIVRGVG